MRKKLFLIDAMAIIYRAHFAFSKRPIINSKGMNTSASYGFTATLLDILNHQQPTHIAVAFDMSGPTFRHKMYPEYKAQRDKQPEDLTENIPWIKDIISAFNIPIYENQEFEADDIIGSLAKQAEKKGFTTYMLTPDKDYAQLVSENIFLYKPASGPTNSVNIMGIPEVLEKFNIDSVEQVIDILALQGDAVDNIPGILGIGPKTASKLLKEFGSLENILENADKLKGKVKENVIKNKENGILSKTLARIKVDIDIPLEEDKLEIKEVNKEALKSIFNKLEFKTLSKKILNKSGDQASSKGVQKSLFGNSDDNSETLVGEEEVLKTIDDLKPQYHLVQSDSEITQLINQLASCKSFAFDTETTSLDAFHAQLVGLSFAINPNEAYYVPIDHETANTTLSYFKSILLNETIVKIGHNLKYDLLVLLNYNVHVKGPIFDTMIAEYILKPEGRHNLDFLARTYLKYETIKIESLIGTDKKGNMRDIPAEKVKDYAAEDADITLQLKHVIEGNINEDTKQLLDLVEYPLVNILAKMEHEGINIDKEHLKRYSATLNEELIGIRDEIYTLAGGEFNISSPKQLGEVLFDKLKLIENPKKTKTGQYATGEEILSKLSNEFPIANKILEYRQCQKLKNTYVDVLVEIASPKDKRVHTTFSQAVVATGRLSSNHPNLQNIPIRTNRGKEIRKAFIPRDDEHLILSADYSQMELRIMASFAEDEVMIEAFKNGLDIHKSTASKIFDVDLDQVTDTQRQISKTANFGIIYGISSFGLSQQLDISRKEATNIIESYFDNFSSIKIYTEKTIQFARDNGYVETWMKRRRYLRDINSRNNMQKNFAERNAINAPIQGTAADITKLAMVEIDQWISSNNLKSKMLLQVHDELVFDVHNTEKNLFETKIPQLMSQVSTLKVPMEVSLGFGQNWLQAH